MKNILLLLFDIICLPVTLIRLFLIYFFGSRYNIPSIQFIDVMMHATDRFFNQGQQNITIDTIPTDVRLSINRASRIDADLIDEYAKFSGQNKLEPKYTKLSNKIDDKLDEKQYIDENRSKSVFGQKNESTIVLHSDKNISSEDIKKLQKLLPKILSQISLINIDKNYIDTDYIDIAKLDKKLDDEIKKELDFLTDFEEDNVDFKLDSITDL